MTRWVQGTLHPAGPLPIVAVEGETTRFAATMLDPYADDIAVRVRHVQPAPPERRRPTVRPAHRRPPRCGAAPTAPSRVEAVAVHHEPVAEAVAYRITTPDAVVVISGDTRVCDEVLDLARGADLLVHEACRASALRDVVAGTPFEHIFGYHADTVALGGLADDAGVGAPRPHPPHPAPRHRRRRGGLRDRRAPGWLRGPAHRGPRPDDLRGARRRGRGQPAGLHHRFPAAERSARRRRR